MTVSRRASPFREGGVKRHFSLVGVPVGVLRYGSPSAWGGSPPSAPTERLGQKTKTCSRTTRNAVIARRPWRDVAQPCPRLPEKPAGFPAETARHKVVSPVRKGGEEVTFHGAVSGYHRYGISRLSVNA